MNHFLAGAFPRNWHITFSYSGKKNEAIELLRKGGHVAIVFAARPGKRKVKKPDKLPENWHGFTVLDGDKTDIRFQDEPGCVIGLRFKHRRGDFWKAVAKAGDFVEPVMRPPIKRYFHNPVYRRNMDEELRNLERQFRGGDESVKGKLRAAYRRAGLLPDSCDVRLSYLTRRELAKAIRADHDCDESACDIAAALDNGFEEVAADMLMSATECENLERLLDEYDVDLYGLNIMNEMYMHPRGWREWVDWFDAHAIQCPSCETYNFPAGSWVPTTCGNCRESLDTESDAEDE